MDDRYHLSTSQIIIIYKTVNTLTARAPKLFVELKMARHKNTKSLKILDLLRIKKLIIIFLVALSETDARF